MKPINAFTLITGGSTGIGFELAKLFAANGHPLILVARNTAELHHAQADLQVRGVQVEIIEKDLFDPDAAFELYEEVQQKGWTVDILVNNAGQGQYGEFADTDLQRELAIIQLNISSLVVLTKLFLRDMLERGRGRILNLSSIASKTPGPWQSVYHGTKAFVQSFTEAIRHEVKDKGVTITALLPGATDTDFFAKAGMESAKVVQEDKLGDADAVAKDGYEALMNGDDMVVSGFMNKLTVMMSKILPDRVVAEQVHQQQKPATAAKTNSL